MFFLILIFLRKSTWNNGNDTLFNLRIYIYIVSENKTFCIVSGLFVESHGIVGNFVYDNEGGDKLEYMLDDDAKWWSEKPSFFVTAEQQVMI